MSKSKHAFPTFLNVLQIQISTSFPRRYLPTAISLNTTAKFAIDRSKFSARKLISELKRCTHSYMHNWKVRVSKPIVPDFPRWPGATFLRPRHCLFYVLQIFEFSLLAMDRSSGGLSRDDDAHLRLGRQ